MTHSPFSAAGHRTDAPDDPDVLAGDLASPVEPSSVPFGRGLVLGLVLAAIAWCILAAVGFALYAVFAQ